MMLCLLRLMWRWVRLRKLRSGLPEGLMKWWRCPHDLEVRGRRNMAGKLPSMALYPMQTTYRDVHGLAPRVQAVAVIIGAAAILDVPASRA